jgi:monovalent cation:H+ antiporter-2, CPA2 family
MEAHAAVAKLHIGMLDQLALIVAFALIAGFLATKLRLPPIVGFLMAGIAVGPFTPGFQADHELVEQLGEIGVVLLMFGVGLHFSVRDLMAVRKVAVPGAVLQTVLATLLGIGVGHIFGWSLGSGLVLGLALSVASTVVLLRALMARDQMNTDEGRIAVGWLIVEDLMSVLIVVVLPVLAVALGGRNGGAYRADDSLLQALFREGDSVLAYGLRQAGVPETLPFMIGVAFLNVAILLGLIFFVVKPIAGWLLKRIESTKSEELFTLFVVATGLFIAFQAKASFGLSVALGAFLAGIALGESALSHRISEDIRPLRDLFGIIFFTAVGILFDPSTILKMPGQLLLVLLVVVVGKPLIAGAIVLTLKQPLCTALTVGPALGQIGEFSFILAVLGNHLGLLPDSGYQLIITAAILSIAFNPVMFWISDNFEKRRQRVNTTPPGLEEVAAMA